MLSGASVLSTSFDAISNALIEVESKRRISRTLALAVEAVNVELHTAFSDALALAIDCGTVDCWHHVVLEGRSTDK